MRLVRLATVSIAGCGMGLAALAGFGLLLAHQIQRHQTALAELATLESATDEISATSDALLTQGGDAQQWRAFRRRAHSIQDRLEPLAERYGEARRAIGQIETLVSRVGPGAEAAPESGASTGGADGIAAVEMSRAARDRLTRVAEAGVSLDTAMRALVEQRRQALARDQFWLGAIFAAAAGLFGLLCVAAFTLLRRRVNQPTRALLAAIERLEAGEHGARAHVSGNDELAHVARAFNRLIDAHETAHREAEQYRALVEGSSDGCAIVDRDGRYRLVNRAYAERFATTPEGIEGRNVSEVIGADAFAQIAEALTACMAGEQRTFEFVMDFPALGARNLVVNYHPIDVGPEHERLVGVITTDVTALERAQADYEALFEAIPDGVLLLRDGRYIVDANTQTAETFGWPRDWLLGREITDVSPARQPDGRPSADKAAEVIDAAIHTGTQRVEWEAIRGDGHHALVEAVLGPLHGSGQADAFAIGRDITAERELRADREQKQRLIEASEDRICIVDSDYRYTFATERYADLYGLNPTALEGADIREVVSREFFEREVKPPIDRALAGEYPAFEAQRHYDRLGWRQFLVRYYPLPSADGSVTQVGNVMTDITALKEAEIRLRKQQHLVELAGRSARLGGWSLDLETGALEWSDIVAEIHGVPTTYTPDLEEAIDFYPPEWHERIRWLVTQCAEHGEPYDEELQIIAADGRRKWVRTTGVPVRDDSGRIVRLEGAFQDISERHEREWKLRQMVHIVEQSPAAITVTDTDGRIEYANASTEAISGYTSDELLGTTQAIFRSGTTPRETYRDLWSSIRAGKVWQGEIQNRRKNGELYWEYEYISPLKDDAGRIVNYVAIKEEITEFKRIEAELRASRDELRTTLSARQALINALPAHIALLDGEGNVVDVNERWRAFGHDNAIADPDFGVGVNYLAVCEQATGECAQEAATVAAELRTLLSGEQGSFALEYPCHGPNEFRWYRVEARRLVPDDMSGRYHGAVVMHIDISERKRAEQELTRLAYEDALTRLPSRNGFIHHVTEQLTSTGWQPDAAVVLLDLNRQRDINDAYGYGAGDALLVQVSHRLATRAGDDAVVARIGGDEFAVFLPAQSETEAAQKREALTRVFEQTFQIEDVAIDVGARFGYSVLGERGRSIEEFIREAELALFVNSDGHTRGLWQRYTPELDADTQRRITLTRELRRALETDEFELHFQPKVELEHGRLISAEALIRWNHPDRGLQRPDVFIPIAEQSQLIGRIGDWALHEACRRAAAWRREGLALVPVAVNVSLAQFTGGDFAETVRQALETFDIPPWALSLEITESVFEQASDHLKNQLKTLHAMGVRLSLDDFGTGYSSLLYLQQYPFDEIKIDKGFVQSMLDDDYSRKIVRTVMTLAQAVGAAVVAEGVENTQVRDALLAEGARLGQGFYYSLPLVSEDFFWLLQQGSTLPLGGVRPQHSVGS